jgi:8-oxo-dGTP pyrophosphatase MutT (NUDIX family)
LGATVFDLLAELAHGLNDWERSKDHYLNVVAPAIAGEDGSVVLTEREKRIVAELRQRLSAEDWREFPALLVEAHERDESRRGMVLREKALRQQQQLQLQKLLRQEEAARRSRKKPLRPV